MSNNNLATFAINAFSNLTKLKSLLISGNEFSVLRSGTFLGLFDLQDVKLGDNNISRIDPGSFNGLENLKRLWLNDNRLSVVNHDTFRGLKELDELHLYFNKIQAIEAGSFRNLGKIKLLSLHKNSLNGLTADMCVGLTSLQKLYISCNRHITTIDYGALANLPRPLEVAIDHIDMKCDTTMCWMQKEVWEGSNTWYAEGMVDWEPKCSKYWQIHCSGKL